MGNRLSSLVICHNTPPQPKPIFNVKATGDSTFLGNGQLEITGDNLILVLLDGSKEHYSWPIRSIRRYGCEKNLFIFESGRRCATGPGVYQLKTKDAKKIMLLVQQSVSAIQEMDNAFRKEMVETVVRPANETEGKPPAKSSLDGAEDGKPRYVNCDAMGRPFVTNYASLDLPRKDDTTGSIKNKADLWSGSYDVLGDFDQKPTCVSGSPVETVEYVRIDPEATKALLS
ncbi:fibroblast growth factor receptor substrate 3-like [Paramacrobiotus metropolitanus]|uniref:fibroblast growth factor receptor substrate 3-like n=1 Tax=Paramacrobiotus metropolitanus TaxID=2943436 RepID=UPI002445B2E9|nr:fibroblast growth factor receptor substrate 3-like [Paramacrobiotus metropolitanus]XP_055333143.1 fibroblast growth factor receptor substrate 3-like [Paramacrobiotus metropolitanus]